MTDKRHRPILACAIAYVLVLHGFVFAAFTAAHAAAAADAAAGIICTPSLDGDERGGEGSNECDCGPICVPAANPLAAPDLIVAGDALVVPQRHISMRSADLALQGPDIRSSPHISRAPPAPISM